jgi:hypothetical protein
MSNPLSTPIVYISSNDRLVSNVWELNLYSTVVCKDIGLSKADLVLPTSLDSWRLRS